MRRLTAICLVVFSLLMAAPVLAAPSNDDFEAATNIASLPFRHSLNMSSATLQPEEPTFCDISASVWYAWTAPTSKKVGISFGGSDFSPSVAVYEGSSFQDFSLVSCAYGSHLSFSPEAGKKYYIQVGPSYWYSSGNLNIHVSHLSAITGQVVNAASEPLESICVVAYLREWERVATATTASDGRYSFVNLVPGSYRVHFETCDSRSPYQAEWYENQNSFSSATVIELDGSSDRIADVLLEEKPPEYGVSAYIRSPYYCGEEWVSIYLNNYNNSTAGEREFRILLDGNLVRSLVLGPYGGEAISIRVPDDLEEHLVTVESGNQEIASALAEVYRCPDYELSSLSIEPVPLRTDQGELISVGHVREISFEVSNLVPFSGAVEWLSVVVSACPATALGCSVIGTVDVGRLAAQSWRGSIQWSAIGFAGDVDIRATVVGSWGDPNTANDSRQTRHYVLVGGSGAGVGVGPGL